MDIESEVIEWVLLKLPKCKSITREYVNGERGFLYKMDIGWFRSFLIGDALVILDWPFSDLVINGNFRNLSCKVSEEMDERNKVKREKRDKKILEVIRKLKRY